MCLCMYVHNLLLKTDKKDNNASNLHSFNKGWVLLSENASIFTPKLRYIITQVLTHYIHT